MKNNIMFLSLFLYHFLSCSNLDKERASQKRINTASEIAVAKSISRGDEKKGSLPQFDFSFSNDTICYEIKLKGLNKLKEYDIPKKMEFQFSLSNKNKADKLFTVNGEAMLRSSNESFQDKKSNDGDYFAADYVFNNADYTIKIRLDVEEYKACVISLKCNNPKNVTIDYSNYIKQYPAYDVMKRGTCN